MAQVTRLTQMGIPGRTVSFIAKEVVGVWVDQQNAGGDWVDKETAGGNWVDKANANGTWVDEKSR
jgi:hypothetical protein